MLKTIPELLADIKPQLALITAAQASEKIANDGAVLIDVREADEFAQQSSSCAVNIPRGLLEMKVLSQYKDHQQVLLVHCATSARACLSAEQLQRLGYENVFVVTCSVNDICMATSASN